MKSFFCAPTSWALVIDNRGEGTTEHHRTKPKVECKLMRSTTRKRTSKRRVKPTSPKPVVVITGAAGNLGCSLGMALRADYDVVGLDPSMSAMEDGADFLCSKPLRTSDVL